MSHESGQLKETISSGTTSKCPIWLHLTGYSEVENLGPQREVFHTDHMRLYLMLHLNLDVHLTGNYCIGYICLVIRRLRILVSRGRFFIYNQIISLLATSLSELTALIGDFFAGVLRQIEWLQEKDKLAGNVPCKWPWFEALDELIGGSPKQSRIGSGRKQQRFSSSPSPRPPGGLPTSYFGISLHNLAPPCI